MNLAKYSPRAAATLVEVQKLARARQHQAIEPEHLLGALLVDELGRAVLERLGVKIADVLQKLDIELTKLPRVAGASNYLSPRFLKVTAAAEVTATKLGGKLVDASHLLTALADPVTLLRRASAPVLPAAAASRWVADGGQRGRSHHAGGVVQRHW